jgi:hypothetical protein
MSLTTGQSLSITYYVVNKVNNHTSKHHWICMFSSYNGTFTFGLHSKGKLLFILYRIHVYDKTQIGHIRMQRFLTLSNVNSI